MLYGLTTVVTSTTRRACTARINFFAMSMQHCHTFTCHGPANGHNSLSLLCSYWNTNACRACRALSFCLIPCNESASGVLLARVTSLAGGYQSPAQNLFLCFRLDQRSVDWHPGHAFHVQQRLFQREKERIASKMYKTVQAYSLQQCICLLSTILLCLPVIYDHWCVGL